MHCSAQYSEYTLIGTTSFHGHDLIAAKTAIYPHYSIIHRTRIWGHLCTGLSQIEFGYSCISRYILFVLLISDPWLSWCLRFPKYIDQRLLRAASSHMSFFSAFWANTLLFGFWFCAFHSAQFRLGITPIMLSCFVRFGFHLMSYIWSRYWTCFKRVAKRQRSSSRWYCWSCNTRRTIRIKLCM